jgi:putative transposase
LINDGICIARKVHMRGDCERPNTHETARKWTSRLSRTLCVIDEFTRESIAARAARAFNSTDVIEALADGGVIRATCGIGGSYLAHHFEAAHHGLVSQG